MKSLNTLRHYGCRTLTALVALVCLAFTQCVWADNLYFVHTDHLGTPVVITDSTQTTVWQGDKTPFGETTTSVNQIAFNVRFPGQYYDAESGLHYNYFRDYDPNLGRYVQSDPIGLRGGLNTYGYVYQNPLRYIDPNGKMTLAEGAVGLGLAGSVYCLLNPVHCEEIRKACWDAWTAWNESSEDEEPAYGPEDWDDVEYGEDGPYTPLPDDYFPQPEPQPDSNANESSSNRTNKDYNPARPHKDRSGGNKGDKHSNGDARRQKDRGGEKGDVRRPY